ncbi:MAG TPA: hypothetical protein VGW99_03460 [Chthoniobacterales bacterium]|jgi:hypothetical protein|nr:hypothetical protein [Chthoniobacterales bacterium]
MPSWFRNGFYFGLGLALVVGLFLIWLWQPERQVNRHTKNLLRKIERKDWAGVSDFLASDYADQWGDDRALVLGRMRQGFGYVRTMRINALDPVVNVDNRRGVWRAKITIEGGGSDLVAFIEQRLNSLATPFDLEWRHVSRKPWDWKLASVRNRDLEIPAGFE